MHHARDVTAPRLGLKIAVLQTGRARGTVLMDPVMVAHAMAAHVMPALRGAVRKDRKDVERKAAVSALAAAKDVAPTGVVLAARTERADLAVPMVLAAVNVVRTLVAPAAWSSGWRRLTASSTKSSARLPL